MGYVVRRLVQILPTVGAILVITFVMVQLAPGDAVDALAGGGGNEAYYDYLRSHLKLDRPLLEQFVSYSGQLLSGDLGVSFVQGGRPVAGLIAERIPATLLLIATALAMGSAGGMVLGSLAARRPFGPFDVGITTTALIGYSVPAFWLAQLALMALAFGTGLFPIQGMTDARASHAGLAHVLDVARHLVLPSLVLATAELALVTRVTRAALVQELDKDYVRTARGMGLDDRQVVFHHALPNALLPVVTVIGNRIGLVFTVTVVVETVFAWPGLGTLLLQAAQTRDRPLLLGLVLVVAAFVALANLATDVIYAWIDPRIRYD
ncbi:MAG: ABC transporter permease [Actinomycetota bacterium]|nr:ABC transporter permease [Actinomycetota bacterium]MDQ3573699.1 ABC transporter permease [Actinomycetota bacterium]